MQRRGQLAWALRGGWGWRWGDRGEGHSWQREQQEQRPRDTNAVNRG